MVHIFRKTVLWMVNKTCGSWTTSLACFRDHILFAIIIILDLKIHESMWIQWPFFQILEPEVIDPKMTFELKSVEVTCVTLPKDHCVPVPQKYIKVCGYSDPFFQKFWTKGHWPLDDLWPPCLFRSHVWLYPRMIVSMSHGNTSMYVDTVINSAKYHIHITYRRYILRTEWVIT